MATRYVASCDCGYERRHRSDALARKGLARHSCARYEAIAARQARGDARRAAVDRTPKACLHKRANHQHGTYACYVLDGCKCLPCAKASSDYESNRKRQVAYGRWNNLVDAEPARQHVRQLMDQGMGLKRIVVVSEVAQGLLWKLMYGKRQADGTQRKSSRIRRETETKILAVRLDLADGARVPSIGAVRRLQALVAIGWSQSKIARRLGMAGNLGLIVHGHRPEITVAHDKAIRALYAEWSMQLPPANEWRDKIAAARSRHYAEAHGWLAPLAWDDEALDDADATPLAAGYEPPRMHATDIDEVAIERRMAGDLSVTLNRAEKFELVRLARAADWSYKDIETRCGISKTERYLTRAQVA